MSDLYRKNFAAIDWSVPIPEAPRPERARGPRSTSVAGPMFISDTMPETECMADGKIYTSKRAMSATHKRMGFIEVGNERPPPKQRYKSTTAERVEAIRKAEARYNRGERASWRKPS